MERFWEIYALRNFEPTRMPRPHPPMFVKKQRSWKWLVQSRVPRDKTYTGQGHLKLTSYYEMFYEGELISGERTGFGTTVYKDGEVYIGEHLNGNKHGKGKYYIGNGDVYDGDYDHGVQSGFARYSWENGNKHEGHYRNYKREGHGRFTEKNGHVIEGEWNDGLPLDENNLFSIENTLSRVNPKVRRAIEQNICTFTVTGKERCGQLFFQTQPMDDRPHGVCVVCAKSCVPQNGITFYQNKITFGGNFYCDCGLHPEFPCFSRGHV